jgi:glutathione synthase/RimK-type ligase-like ATP-grasp enzyme
MFDERIYHVENTLHRVVYPSYQELLLYENKRHMAYFLAAHGLPSPKTHVFYDLNEAIEFTEHAAYPLIFKTHLGAQARGVTVLRTKRHAQRLIRRVFRTGYYRRIRTNLRGLLKRHIMLPYYFFDPEYKTVLLQEYVHDVLEWRMIRIGDSYFGHQKLRRGEFHSGSGAVAWVTPPDSLLRLVKQVCDVGNFWSMALDIFEDPAGRYYINELQTVFGSYNPSQMYVDGKPGRFLYEASEDRWVFEEGYFCQNGSCNLRVLHLMKILASQMDE